MAGKHHQIASDWMRAGQGSSREELLHSQRPAGWARYYSFDLWAGNPLLIPLTARWKQRWKPRPVLKRSETIAMPRQ